MSRDVDAILSQARFLPHALDMERRAVLFLACDPDRVQSAAFIDGRTDFSSAPSILVPWTEILRHVARQPSSPYRLIFHVGFCGSTFLSRLLDAPGRVRVLREPNILADLARHQASLDIKGQADPDFASLCRAVCTMVHRPWTPGEDVVVKPSNWANNLLPHLGREHELAHGLFLVTSRAAFVRSIFRGGHDRLAFAARAAVHLSSREQSDAALVAAALARNGDDLDRLAGLAIALHGIQARMFIDATGGPGRGGSKLLHHATIAAAPGTASRHAQKILAIGIPEDQLGANLTRWSGHNAKAPDIAYSSASERRQTMQAEAAHGDCIRRALDWASQTVGTDPFAG